MMYQLMADIKQSIYMILAVILTSLVTFYFGLATGLCLSVVLVLWLAAMLRRELRLHKHHVEAELLRKLGMQRLESDVESAEWFNLILSRFWLIYEPVLSETILASVNPILEYYTPNFIVRIKLDIMRCLH